MMRSGDGKQQQTWLQNRAGLSVAAGCVLLTLLAAVFDWLMAALIGVARVV